MTTAAEHQESSPLSARSRATKFTPERLQQIINLVERGKSRAEIAAILDVTVGSLQVTCSKIGISLKRPKIENGAYLLRKRTPLLETSYRSTVHNGRAPLRPAEEQVPENLQSQPVKAPVLAKPEEQCATTPAVCPARFALCIEYRGMKQTHELPLSTQTIGLLALEATLRQVSIGELIAEIITAMVDEDLFQPVLGEIAPV